MIGTATGTMVSTQELFEMVVDKGDVYVSVDHEKYLVQEVDLRNVILVTLAPQFGADWDLEVARSDQNEPMWEIV
jgi:L-alanine-DL-glutamate epimerase-like enolase superfamily enzyme